MNRKRANVLEAVRERFPGLNTVMRSGRCYLHASLRVPLAFYLFEIQLIWGLGVPYRIHVRLGKGQIGPVV
jgi:hypothetical protein